MAGIYWLNSLLGPVEDNNLQLVFLKKHENMTSNKRIALFELTCPLERNLHTANTYKHDKYSGMQGDLEDKGWKVHLVPYEVRRADLEKHKSFNHCHTEAFQNQNQSRATHL